MTQEKNKIIYSFSLYSFSITDLNSVINSLSNLPVPETPSGFKKLVWGLLVLSVVTIWIFIDITFHFLVIVIIQNYSFLLDKYPKLKLIVNFYKN